MRRKNWLRISLGLLGLLLAPAARAETIYFGGVGAQSKITKGCYPQLNNYGYPVSGASLAALITKINKDPNAKFTLVGHSSGARYSNYLAARVKNPGRITVVALDGFAPRGLPKAVNTVCWKANNGRGVSSRNAGSMAKGNGCKIVKTQVAKRCETPWCLHFALVNTNAPARLNGGNFISSGYNSCRPGPFAANLAEAAEAAETKPAAAKKAPPVSVKEMIRPKPAPCPKTGPRPADCQAPAAVSQERAPKLPSRILPRAPLKPREEGGAETAQ